MKITLQILYIVWFSALKFKFISNPKTCALNVKTNY